MRDTAKFLKTTLIGGVLLLVAICFVVGLIVRTGPGLRVKNAFEQAVLGRLPGYPFFRGLAKRLTGQRGTHAATSACRNRRRTGSSTDR